MMITSSYIREDFSELILQIINKLHITAKLTDKNVFSVVNLSTRATDNGWPEG